MRPIPGGLARHDNGLVQAGRCGMELIAKPHGAETNRSVLLADRNVIAAEPWSNFQWRFFDLCLRLPRRRAIQQVALVRFDRNVEEPQPVHNGHGIRTKTSDLEYVVAGPQCEQNDLVHVGRDVQLGENPRVRSDMEDGDARPSIVQAGN